MGWTYGYRSPADIRDSLKRERTSTTLVLQKATAYGRHLWSLYEKDGVRFIVLDLIAGGKHYWGYKTIDESMGPVEVDCPEEILNAASETQEKYAVAWRERVRAYIANRRRQYAKGDRVTIYGNEYSVVEKVGRSYRVARESDGRVFKTTTEKMAPVTVTA